MCIYIYTQIYIHGFLFRFRKFAVPPHILVRKTGREIIGNRIMETRLDRTDPSSWTRRRVLNLVDTVPRASSSPCGNVSAAARVVEAKSARGLSQGTRGWQHHDAVVSGRATAKRSFGYVRGELVRPATLSAAHVRRLARSRLSRARSMLAARLLSAGGGGRRGGRGQSRGGGRKAGVAFGYNSSAATRHHVGTPLDTPPMPSAWPEIDAPQRDVSKPPPVARPVPSTERRYTRTLPPSLSLSLPTPLHSTRSLLCSAATSVFLPLILLVTACRLRLFPSVFPPTLFGRCSNLLYQSMHLFFCITINIFLYIFQIISIEIVYMLFLSCVIRSF